MAWKKLGGKTNRTIVSQTEPSNPSKGDEWVDTSYTRPGKKVWTGSSWSILIGGSNLSQSKKLTTEKTISVSDSNETTKFELQSGGGEDSTANIVSKGQGYGCGWQCDNTDAETFEGGLGKKVVARINLSKISTLKITTHKGGSKTQVTQTLNDYDGNFANEAEITPGDGGRGLSIRDGNDNILVQVTGGGGAGIRQWESRDGNENTTSGANGGGKTGEVGSGNNETGGNGSIVYDNNRTSIQSEESVDSEYRNAYIKTFIDKKR